jgi:hypothetical protein
MRSGDNVSAQRDPMGFHELASGDGSQWFASDFPVVRHAMAHAPWPAAVVPDERDLVLSWNSHGYDVVARIVWADLDREEGSIELTATAPASGMPDDRPAIRATGTCTRFRHQQELQASQ